MHVQSDRYAVRHSDTKAVSQRHCWLDRLTIRQVGSQRDMQLDMHAFTQVGSHIFRQTGDQSDRQLYVLAVR